MTQSSGSKCALPPAFWQGGGPPSRALQRAGGQTILARLARVASSINGRFGLAGRQLNAAAPGAPCVVAPPPTRYGITQAAQPKVPASGPPRVVAPPPTRYGITQAAQPKVPASGPPRVVAPPPTRYAITQAAQPKVPASGPPRVVAPPPTRYGITQAAQPKAAVSSPPRVVAPPPTRYAITQAAQPKAAASFRGVASPPLPCGSFQRLPTNRSTSLRQQRQVGDVVQRMEAEYDSSDETKGYDTDVEHDEIPDELFDAPLDAQPVRLLTLGQYEVLDDQGYIDPNRLRTAQGGIELKFRDEDRTIFDTKDQLVADPSVAKKIPPVSIGVYEGRVWVFDTRRVVSAQIARSENLNVRLRYKKISGRELEDRAESILTRRRWQGVVTAVRYEGKHSGSYAHVNPHYAAKKKVGEELSFGEQVQIGWRGHTYHGGHRSFSADASNKPPESKTDEKLATDEKPGKREKKQKPPEKPLKRWQKSTDEKEKEKKAPKPEKKKKSQGGEKKY